MRCAPSLLVMFALAAADCGSRSHAAEAPMALRPRAPDPPAVVAYDAHSARLKRDYLITVAVPAGYAEHRERRFPVLFVTDANFFFDIVHSIWRVLDGEIDTPVLVGIGPPPDSSRGDVVRRRVHEFSPLGWRMDDPFGQEVQRVVPECRAAPPGSVPVCTGGAPEFLAFITDELLPALGSSYRIDADDLGLFGDSAGGFFAAWTLLQGDRRFRHYIIGSPVLAYGDGSIFALEERYAAAHHDLSAAVYLGSGTLEQLDREVEFLGRVVSGSAHLAASLSVRGYPHLQLHSETHRDLDHGTVVPLVALRGLLLTYPKTERAGSP